MEAQRLRFLTSLRQEIKSPAVLSAFARVPRERFVSPEYQHLAYADTALPIGEGQTISQPLIVALMTQSLELITADRVLEVGTGSGYQAAILAELAQRVVTVERVPEIADTARDRLSELGYRNIEVHLAQEDQLGWPEGAPYDAIVVTAAAPRIPSSLLAQLRDGGRMVIPVGPKEEQELLQVRKLSDKTLIRRISYCRFVPLLGADGWPEPGKAQHRPR